MRNLAALRWTLAVAAGWGAAAGQGLEEAVEAILASPAAQRASWGVHAVELATGRVLYSKNASVPMTPASNTKLFTTALALLRLGPDYRFQTRVVAGALPDAGGRLRGDLRLVGGGDPSLSGRPAPDRPGAAGADPLGPLRQLADQTVARGLRIVDGDLIGDATRWPWAPYPAGWAIGDMTWDYGAPVSALVVNDNAVLLTIRPGRKEGDAAEVSFEPAVEYFTVFNALRTSAGAARKIAVRRAPGARVLEITGAAPPGGGMILQRVAADEPALFAAQAFARVLRERGVEIRGRVRGLVRAPAAGPPDGGGVELARRESPPLAELLKVVDKVSQNLHAEMMLREVAHVLKAEGTVEAGVELIAALLQEAGAGGNEFDFEDGSGLSRRTLAAPAAITALLRYIALRPEGEIFRSLLPVAGEDGTLAARFRGVAGIQAKTGSLAHVAALSGYAGQDPGRRVAFSIVANGATAPSGEIRALIDKIAVAILMQTRR